MRPDGRGAISRREAGGSAPEQALGTQAAFEHQHLIGLQVIGVLILLEQLARIAPASNNGRQPASRASSGAFHCRSLVRLTSSR
jgi:hypothetical protein